MSDLQSYLDKALKLVEIGEKDDTDQIFGVCPA